MTIERMPLLPRTGSTISHSNPKKPSGKENTHPSQFLQQYNKVKRVVGDKTASLEEKCQACFKLKSIVQKESLTEKEMSKFNKLSQTLKSRQHIDLRIKHLVAALTI